MIYEINCDSFELKDIFECGQCFRWNKDSNDTYTGIIDKCVINVEKIDKKIVFNGDIENATQEEFEQIIKRYFDLDRDYENIKNKLSKVDGYLKDSIKYGKGIRILNQNLWETIISFIISANNNIPRIKGIIEKICRKYGEELKWEGKIYYTFPTAKQLSNASVQDLRNLGLGFRDTRVFETTRLIDRGIFDLGELYMMKTEFAKERLLTLPGVGPKVADCILLFSDLKRFDVFPIDVWVRRVMNELYIHNDEEEKVNKKEIQKLANEKFGELQGIAQQYLFYWKREA